MKREKTRTLSLLIRLTPEEKKQMEERCEQFGFTQVSEFVRALALKGKLEIK
jgi:hypothetical protein